MRNTNVKNEKGITLIVLVITVVILFILSLLVVDFTVDGKLFKTANELGAKGEAQQTETETLRNSWKDMLGLTNTTTNNNTTGNTTGDNTTGGETTCTHTSTTATDNGDGTHTITCTNCGKQITTEKHNYVNRKCTKCGAQKLAVAGEKTTETLEFTDSDGNKAIIPKGFTVSKADDEKTIEKGLVIYLINDKTEEEIKAIDWSNEETVADLRTKYDQFVWIPISHTKINEMFICQEKAEASDKCSITVKNGVATCTTHNSTQMAGRLYATDTGETYKDDITETYTPNSGLREPDVVIGSNGTSYDADPTYLGNIATVTGDSTSYANKDKFKETLQTEYNEIVKSIYNAEGFWVGRYETSNMTQNPNTAVKVVAGTNTGISNVNWYYMYGQQKAYSANKNLSGVKSSMILGACHDQVLEFVNTENYNVKQAGNVGHTSSEFTTKPYLTGGIGYSENYSGTIAYNDVSRNVYDLEGNVYEWTTESISSAYRVGRGRHLQRQQFS